MRKLEKQVFGPDWATQLDPGAAAAALGSQRGGPGSKFALPPLLQSGLSKEQHIAGSAKLTFPVHRPVQLDDDLDFAARATAVLGTFANTH